MKKLVTLLTLISTVNVFAYGMDKFDISANYSTLYDTEEQAVAAGVAVETKIKAKKFKSQYHVNANCEFGSDVNYYTKSVEVKKLYIDGVAKYKTTVNFILECEEEYQM